MAGSRSFHLDRKQSDCVRMFVSLMVHKHKREYEHSKRLLTTYLQLERTRCREDYGDDYDLRLMMV